MAHWEQRSKAIEYYQSITFGKDDTGVYGIVLSLLCNGVNDIVVF